MKTKQIHTKLHDLKEGVTGGWDFFHSMQAINWQIKHQRTACLSGHLAKELEAKFGKPDFHFTGGSENRRFKVWSFQHDSYTNSYTILVLTNSIKGTCIEANKPLNDKVAVAFLKWLKEQLFQKVAQEKP